MTHERMPVSEVLRTPSEQNFGATFTAVLAAGASISWWNGWPGGPIPWLLSAAILATITLVRAKTLALPNVLWFRFGIALNKIVAPFVWAVLFFLVITPAGLLGRAFGKRFLQKKRHSGRDSYWVARDSQMYPDDFDKQF